jgi:hypothetical protein
MGMPPNQCETIGGPNKKNDKDVWILLELNGITWGIKLAT